MRGSRLGVVDRITRAIENTKILARIRELAQEPAGMAVPELVRLLQDPERGEPILARVLVAVRSFGAQAAEALPEVEKIAQQHDNTQLRGLARSVITQIRKGGQAIGDTS